jgi:hypothetical protein
LTAFYRCWFRRTNPSVCALGQPPGREFRTKILLTIAGRLSAHSRFSGPSKPFSGHATRSRFSLQAFSPCTGLHPSYLDMPELFNGQV